MRFLTLFTLLLMANWTIQVQASDMRISTSWTEMTTGQIKCLQTAESVLWYNKFKNSDHGNESAWATKGRYKALVGCVAEKGMAFFVVVGPDGKQTREIADKVSSDFRKELGITDK